MELGGQEIAEVRGYSHWGPGDPPTPPAKIQALNQGRSVQVPHSLVRTSVPMAAAVASRPASPVRPSVDVQGDGTLCVGAPSQLRKEIESKGTLCRRLGTSPLEPLLDSWVEPENTNGLARKASRYMCVARHQLCFSFLAPQHPSLECSVVKVGWTGDSRLLRWRRGLGGSWTLQSWRSLWWQKAPSSPSTGSLGPWRQLTRGPTEGPGKRG